MKSTLFLSIFALLSSVALTVNAQKYKASPPKIQSPKAPIVINGAYSFDLGGPANSVTYTVKRKKNLTLLIYNFLPTGHYTLNESQKLNLSPPLDTGEHTVAAVKDSCTSIEASLKDAKTESEYAKLMATAKESKCTIYKADSIASTLAYTITGRQNEITIITITNTDSKLTWTITLQPEDNGQFVTLYGFTYIPYLFDKPHTYYAQPTGTAGTYKIQRGSNEGIASYAPTVAFHYINKNSINVSHSFTAGLGIGFNSDNSGLSPVALLGYSLLVHQNIGFNIGIASHLINDIKGQYSRTDQIISTNLESTDLTQKVIGFNPFFSVVFRFGSSPFSAKKINPPSGSSTTTNGGAQPPVTTGQ